MEHSNEEKLKAAYALNLCTVSISQIIDYNDINVLEQEYEGILNNLNLEQMPKDEALLLILKQILDTITFFRIQEGDKNIIDREYQHKMKNAIWSAVPNLSMVVATNNPISLGISLASQVGIGYMNYRRNKAEYQLNKEKEYWQLQRSAIEQFNGLRRELFDTAWRLADEYEFPDEYRLTERQIKQYNHILMDQDLLRRYERLNTIKDKFEAYPPFWYQFGSTANSIYGDETLGLDLVTRTKFKQSALNCFSKYEEVNVYNLLREDALTSAWALEYIDLLDVAKDREHIEKLTDIAMKYSGDANDVLELCIFSYLKIGNYERAADILRILVNEEYNTVVNAQILSRIYVSEIVSKKREDAEADYKILAKRIPVEYLYPLPVGIEDGEGKYLLKQKNIVIKEYRNALDAFTKKYMVRFNRVLPVPSTYEGDLEFYYGYTPESASVRRRAAQKVLGDKNLKWEYVEMLKDVRFGFRYLEILNHMISALNKLSYFKKSTKKDEYIESVRNRIRELSKEMNALQKKMENEPEAFSINDYKMFQNKFSFRDFTGEFFDKLRMEIQDKLAELENMQSINNAEYELICFCREQELASPIFINGKQAEDFAEISYLEGVAFDGSLLGKTENANEEKRKELYEKMLAVIKKAAADIIREDTADLVFRFTKEKVHEYLTSPDLKGTVMESDVLAILDDTSSCDMDLIFTPRGITRVHKNHILKSFGYRDIQFTDKNGKKQELILGWPDKYSNASVNMEYLAKLIEELNKLHEA